MSRPLLFSGLLILLASACAEPVERGTAPHRRGTEPDLGPPADAGPDAAVIDVGAPPDAAIDAAVDASMGRPPRRETWLAFEWDDPQAGLRAQLEPAQTAAPLTVEAALDALPGTLPVVRWWGPDSPGDRALRTLRAAGRPHLVLYDFGRRAATTEVLRDAAESDLRGLVAAGLDHAHRLDGRPAVAVRVDLAVGEEREAWGAARARVAEVAAVAWVVGVDPGAPVELPSAGAAHFPTRACGGLAGPPLDACAAWRAAALDAGRRWIARASTPTNPRLDRPDAVAEPPERASLTRSMIRARRRVDDRAPRLLVDAIGAWREDGQLDPVEGAPTDHPVALTSGLIYEPYGHERLEAVRTALLRRAGPPPDDLAQAAPLLVIEEEGLRGRAEIDVDGIAVQTSPPARSGRVELLIDDRPWIVPQGAALRYHRSGPALRVDLEFEGGARLLDARAAPLDDVTDVETSLSPFADRRVDAVLLVWEGDAGVGTVSGIRVD